MPQNPLITRAEKVFMHNYALNEMVPERAEGCWQFDTEGRKYLDFAAGIAVASLGHKSPVLRKAIVDQLDTGLIICPATYATLPRIEAAEALVAASCFDKVFFCNSGAEANEGAMKLARKWAYETKGPQANEFISFHNAFHGRTFGAVSLTEKSLHHPFFAPYLPGVRFAVFNDIDSVRRLISDKTAAIFVEPVQGEGGLIPAEPGFMRALRTVCDEKSVALVMDEVQTGIGRLGTVMAYERFGIEPDIATWAKGIGGGFPVGAFAAKERLALHMTHDVHGTTFGGNPLACAVVRAILSEVTRPGFIGHVNQMGEKLYKGLEEIATDIPAIRGIRGMGLIWGFDIGEDHVGPVRKALQSNGLLALQAGKSVVRLTPPLTVNAAQIDTALEIIRTTLHDYSQRHVE